MAQQDAMETAKEVLRQIIKYRFWISIGAAALFAVIAYAVGSGPVREKAAKETASILGTEKEVKTYNSPSIPTKEYEPIVKDKTKVLDKDVTTAWRTLFERQAPLLTWPETVQERFQSWGRKYGRKYPEKEDPRKIELAIVDYIEAYPSYVSMVYKTFNPFDYETGEGIVAAAPEADLLRPSQFSQDHLPDLGKVWAAQERLWIQRTVLEVIAEVNKNAKKWDDSIIRQIVSLEVGNPDSQDQRSVAKNDALQEAEGIYAPGEEPAATEAATGSAGVGRSMPGLGSRGAGGGGMMGGGGGGMRPGGGEVTENVFYVKSDSEKYKILPLVVTVLIDQDRVQDFLIELENSPMSIQVKDFELLRPSSRVTKPEKGESGASFGMMGGMMGGGRMGAMGGGMGGMVGMGGMAGQMEQMMRSQMQQRGGGGMAMMGGPGGGGAPAAKKQGKDMRGKDATKERIKKGEALEKSTGPSLFDPHFDIVQVKVYGQARFFVPPPDEPAAEPSSGETAAAAAAPAAPADAAAKNGQAAGSASPAPADAAAAKPAAAEAAEKVQTPEAKKSDETGKPADPAAKAAPLKKAPGDTDDEAAKTDDEPAKGTDEAAKGKDDAAKPAAKAAPSAKPDQPEDKAPGAKP